jgi:hypothetical protein
MNCKHSPSMRLMVNLPGITTSWTIRNPSEQVLFAGNYQLIDKESNERMDILSGSTSSKARIPQEERNITGNYQLIDERNPPRKGAGNN